VSRPAIDPSVPLGDKLPSMNSAALWKRPGGQLVRLVLPAWKEVVPGDAVDRFLARKLPDLVQMAEVWILDDSRRRSEAAIPDDALEAALEAAAGGEHEVLLELAEGVVGDYWAMEALVRRAVLLHPKGTLMSDTFARAGTEHGALVAAIRGERPSGWRPPVYRASPMSPEDKRLEEESRDLRDEEVLSLLQVRQHSLDSLEHQATTMTRAQIVASLNRLINLGRIWRLAESGKRPQYAPISRYIGMRPPPKTLLRQGGRPSADEVHGGPAREAGRQALKKARALGGNAERATDLLRLDADGRTLARALLDLTAPRRSLGEVIAFLGKVGHRGAELLISRAENPNPESLQRRVWEKVLLEEPVIRVKGTADAPRVLRPAIREDVDATWVAVRRVEAGRAWLQRVDVEVVGLNPNGSVTVRPMGDGVLRPEDEIHLWVRSSPAKLAEIYDVLEDFFDDLKYKPDDLASVRPLLFWTGVMLDTRQCTGEARQAATRAFKQAKLYYDVARESLSRRSDVWTLGALRRVAAAASAVASACAEGKRPLPGFVFFEPSWQPRFPNSIKTPRQRALYEILGQNTGLALRVDAAAANVAEEPLEAALSRLLPGEKAVEHVVSVLNSVDDMNADPDLRRLYNAVDFDYQKARDIHRVLDAAPDGWRRTRAKQRIVMGELFEVLGDEETAERVFEVAIDVADL